ncbi:MAG: hypothetical protein ACE5NW_06650 [Acidiferrobacterales bacterium]
MTNDVCKRPLDAEQETLSVGVGVYTKGLGMQFFYRCPHTPARIQRWVLYPTSQISGIRLLAVFLPFFLLLASCSGDSGNLAGTVSADNPPIQIDDPPLDEEPPGPAESCMSCHNGSSLNDYAGRGLENPHPFSGAANLKCTTCHGGDGQAGKRSAAHVPPPPEIGNKAKLTADPEAYFNRLTLTGIDKLPDYEVGGKTYSALDYLQFINPGDLRVVVEFRSCGECHGPNALSSPASKHAEWAARSPLGTETGIFSGAIYALGIDNAVPENRDRYEDTAADLSFRAVANPNYQFNAGKMGAVGRLLEFPVFSVFGNTRGTDLFRNPFYSSVNLPNDLRADNSVRPNSALANLYHEQVAFTCGDCHLGSAGANNRYGDFRSSGCTACHMPYSLDGRSRSGDLKVNKNEPANPDAIVAPERPHIRRHLIQSVAKTLSSGEFVHGINDYACAGCHQGSNRTVMQYWGIRLDQNADLANGFQYPANPARFVNTANDRRLFDPRVNNQTFNGRNADQYILFEDYDDDGRDDTPPDVHYEAGLGCIDCHSSRDLHGGTDGDASSGEIVSRQEQAVAITCESCHGGIDAYAQTKSCVAYDGTAGQCAVDAKGNALRHVTKGNGGEYYLVSRLTGQRHYIPQSKDTVSDSGVFHPSTNNPVYNAMASYAMGRADGDLATGMGPQQTNASLVSNGFSHTDEMSCTACHASWTNGCIGCHLGGQYDDNPNNFFFSNITGERIVFKQANADFVYQTPVPFQLGIDAHNNISPISPNTTTFFRYTDLNGDESRVFAFSDRNGNGNNPNTAGRNAFSALSHNVMMPHSIRGRVRSGNEGPRYCVACHLTEGGLANFGRQAYRDYRAAMANNDFADLDFNLLQRHIGQNPGNQLDSPLWVHMVSGLGSGLFLLDQDGCPVNPLDRNANRQYCKNGAPANNFNLGNVVYNLDRIVEQSGVANSSNNHPMLRPGQGKNKRDGALNPNLAGPLGATLIRRLSDPDNGIVLDSWIDADAQPRGDATKFVNGR